MRWGIEAGATGTIVRSLTWHGAAVEADLADTGSPGLIFNETERRLGNVTALVMCHCESVDSGLLVAVGPSEPEHRPGPSVHRAARHRPVEPAELPRVLPPLAGKAALRASVQSCLAPARRPAVLHHGDVYRRRQPDPQLLETSDIGPIPVLVHTLGAATDKAAALVSVAKALQAVGGLTGTSGGTTPMMQYEIEYAEPWASSQPAALSDQRGSFDYHNDLNTAQWYQYVCPLIPKSAAAVGSQQLTASRVPVLSFNGDADPADQPRNMAGMSKFWPDSREIVLPGQGHYVTSASWLVGVR